MKRFLRLGGFFLVVIALLALSHVAQGQTTYPLSNCLDGAFSTEEDFMMEQNEPYDGNPYISDGDLLSPSGRLCARNADLLRVFTPAGVGAIDLGLDAVDILDFDSRLVAFSTSLDDPWGKFTAGDLLFTNGGIIPNAALVYRFGISHDIGLDAVHFVGTEANIKAFAASTLDTPPEAWTNDHLQNELARYGIDIWFSIEGTQWSVTAAPILDGDLLSAMGGVVVPQANLLPNSVPAGLPQRGVDFGLDAVTARRLVGDANLQTDIYFSTEILFRGEPPFTDGDVLRINNGVVIPNEVLIKPFYPKADFLGLDAFWAPVEPSNPPQDPNIQTMCGDRPVADFDGGIVPPGGSGSGLYKTNLSTSPPGTPPRRPCGEYVPIDGYLPAGTVNKFRVAYRSSGSSVPAVGTAAGIRTDWVLYEWWGWPFNACLPTGTLSTDSDGWMDASDYLGAKDGTLTGCANSGLRLAVWDTNNHLMGPPDPNGHYVLWLEWEDSSSTLHREPMEHHLQLDNTLPQINALALRYTDSSGVTQPVPPCGGASAGTHLFQVYGDFHDDYYWGYKLRVRGGNPPNAAHYGWHNYYDGSPPVANTNLTGTTPLSTLVYLRDIDMHDLGASFVDCCYDLDLWVRDAAIRHSFNHRVANDVSGSNAWWDNAFLTFAASP